MRNDFYNLYIKLYPNREDELTKKFRYFYYQDMYFELGRNRETEMKKKFTNSEALHIVETIRKDNLNVNEKFVNILEKLGLIEFEKEDLDKFIYLSGNSLTGNPHPYSLKTIAEALEKEGYEVRKKNAP